MSLISGAQCLETVNSICGLRCFLELCFTESSCVKPQSSGPKQLTQHKSSVSSSSVKACMACWPCSAGQPWFFRAAAWLVLCKWRSRAVYHLGKWLLQAQWHQTQRPLPLLLYGYVCEVCERTQLSHHLNHSSNLGHRLMPCCLGATLVWLLVNMKVTAHRM